jgi:hypothetical protein
MGKAISVKRKRPGRPATGSDPLVGVRLPESMIAALDSRAAQHGTTRSQLIRDAVAEMLRTKPN